MVTLTTLDQLMARHLKRFADMEKQRAKAADAAGNDLQSYIIKLVSGPGIGASRLKSLRKADFPFALRHGAPLWPTPPIGQISGDLARSIKVKRSAPYGKLTMTAVSKDRAAPFIFSFVGTSLMVPRFSIPNEPYTFAMNRMRRLGRDLLRYELGLL